MERRGGILQAADRRAGGQSDSIRGVAYGDFSKGEGGPRDKNERAKAPGSRQPRPQAPGRLCIVEGSFFDPAQMLAAIGWLTMHVGEG